MKKAITIIISSILALVVLCAAVYLIGSGFSRMSNVYLADYEVSESGESITINVAVASSVGYTRAIDTQLQSSGLYVTFYPAFGGINGNWGAKHIFEIELEDECSQIYFYNGNDWTLVLEKDLKTKKWQEVR